MINIDQLLSNADALSDFNSLERSERAKAFPELSVEDRYKLMDSLEQSTPAATQQTQEAQAVKSPLRKTVESFQERASKALQEASMWSIKHPVSNTATLGLLSAQQAIEEPRAALHLAGGTVGAISPVPGGTALGVGFGEAVAQMGEHALGMPNAPKTSGEAAWKIAKPAVIAQVSQVLLKGLGNKVGKLFNRPAVETAEAIVKETNIALGGAEEELGIGKMIPKTFGKGEGDKFAAYIAKVAKKAATASIKNLQAANKSIQQYYADYPSTSGPLSARIGESAEIIRKALQGRAPRIGEAVTNNRVAREVLAKVTEGARQTDISRAAVKSAILRAIKLAVKSSGVGALGYGGYRAAKSILGD